MDIKHIKELQQQLNTNIADLINAYQKATSVKLAELKMHPVQTMDGSVSVFITSKIEL